MSTPNNTGRLSGVVVPADATVDLHMHTTASDGRFTPAELAKAASELGITVIALADHDRVDNVIPLQREAAQYGIHVIPAVEASCQWDGTVYHMLVYNVDVTDTRFTAPFEDAKRHYAEIIDKGLQQLAEQGKPIDPAIMNLCTRGVAVAPYHVFQAIIKHEYAGNMRDAHEMAKTVGIDFLPWPDMRDLIKRALETGAIPILAHPARAEPGFQPPKPETLDAMLEAGLMGFEVWHPYHSAYDVAWYLKLCQDRGLLTSSGSDTHAPNQQPRRLTAWPNRYSRALLERCGITLGPSNFI
jgi:3',5'-nucleoside bisphosphate phosphatase